MSVACTTSILSLLAAALNILGRLIGIRTRPTAKQLAEKAAHAARAASATGDSRAVNAAVERERIKSSLNLALLLTGPKNISATSSTASTTKAS